MYAGKVKAANAAIVTLLQGSTREFLKKVRDADIMVGEKLKNWKYPSIYLEPNVDKIADFDITNQESMYAVDIVTVVKQYKSQDLIDSLIDYTGDVYDELMLKVNRTLSDIVRLNTVGEINWGRNLKGVIIRWSVITCTVEMLHKVT